MDYDYREAVKTDMLEWAKENINIKDFVDDEGDVDIDALTDEIDSGAYIADSVTGNGSGSYYCSSYKAEESLCHNWDLLDEALGALSSSDEDPINKGAEWCDVLVRCYLVSSLSAEVAEELAEEFSQA